jgi:transaldolase
MQLFIDSADPKEIREAWDWGIIDGVTTNPSLAAKAGAVYVSPFVGRLDDVDPNSGDTLVEDIRTMYDNYDFDTEILYASVRDVKHVADAALIGADVATVPFEILKQLVQHPLTDKGLAKFLEDWKASGLALPV